MRYGVIILITMLLAGCAPSLLINGDSGSAVRVMELRHADLGSYQAPKHLRYGFTLQNTENRVLETAEFWTYAPVKQTASQRLVRVSSSEPFELIEDPLGNQILHFTFKNIPPFAAKIVTIQADLFMADAGPATPLPGPDRFLAAETYVEAGNPKIVQLAARLRGQSSIDSARAIHDWVAENIRSQTYIPDDRGALYALEHRLGDCTEFMYLFMALGRANGIPARGVGGYVLPGDAVLDPIDYHNWAEFYVDGAWQIADAQKRSFVRDQAKYVAMRIIAGGTDSPLRNTHRFNYSGAGLKVSMN